MQTSIRVGYFTGSARGTVGYAFRRHSGRRFTTARLDVAFFFCPDDNPTTARTFRPPHAVFTAVDRITGVIRRALFRLNPVLMCNIYSTLSGEEVRNARDPIRLRYISDGVIIIIIIRYGRV